MRVMVVGIDGLDFEWAAPRLPSDLCAVPLESQIGLTGTEWTSMLTGIPFSTLGAYDYYGRAVGDSADVVRYGDLAGHYIWEIAEAAGYSAAICRAPACYPPRTPKNGWILSGVGAHDSDDAFATSDASRYPPPSWHEDRPPDPYIHGSILHYLGHESLFTHRHKGRVRRFITGVGQEKICQLAQRDGNQLIDHLARHSKDADLGFIYFGLIDILLHSGSGLHTENHVEEPYRVVLELVARSRELLQPEHLFIVSDHGGKAGRHRSCGVLAWTPSDVTAPVWGDVVLGEPTLKRGGIRKRPMQRVPVLEALWNPWSYEVAEMVLRPLGLSPVPYGGRDVGATYTDDEQERVTARLEALGYL